MAFGKMSLLFGSILSSVFNSGVKSPEYNHALFFIGNGAYYSLSAQDSLKEPNQWDSYTNHSDFIRNFIPDSIVSDFTRALLEKEPHIFINAKTWNSFVRARLRAQQLFSALAISNPLDQIHIDNTTVIPTILSNQIEKELVLPDKGTQACNISAAARTTRWNHPLFFSNSSVESLKLLPIKQRLDAFKQKATILHPNLHTIFYYLYTFDPALWRVYNTGHGIYYITLKNINSSAIQTKNFVELNAQKLIAEGLPFHENTQEFAWVKQLDKIFSSTTTHWRIYISGHGSNLVTSPDGNIREEHCVEDNESIRCTRAQIAGMPSTYFKQLLQFFNEKIKVDRLIVSSCFTPASRLIQLLPGQFTFDLITPISTYIEVKSFSPIVYTSQYAPAWLSSNNNRQLEYTVHNSGDKARTPLLSFKKFSALLDTKISENLTSYMRNLYDPQAEQNPAIIYAGKNTVTQLK